MNKIYYFSDFLLEDLIGGGELNDNELCMLISDRGYKLEKIRTREIKKQHIDKNNLYIISNFIGLNHVYKDYITKNCKYIIYEHDHKYLKSRNPAIYNDYLAPKKNIINKEFYQNAATVFCQSSFHKKILQKNLKINNVYNVSGNIWKIKDLETMRKLSKKNKNESFSIMNSMIEHKNTKEAIYYCNYKKLKYTLISSKNYEEFLNLLSNNSKFLFLPKTPETLSRVVVEALMMNVKVITNKKVGASYEPWFNMKGEELINFMLNKRQEIVDKTSEVLCG